MSDAPAGLQALLTAIALENLPHQYEDTKHWGQTKEVFDGLNIQRDGLRIKTKRRTKHVKHGTWRKYRLTLVDPSKNLFVRVSDLDDRGQGKVGFHMTVAAKVRAEGRLTEWRRGVQLVSLSAEGEGQVQLGIECQVGMVLDPSHLPPDVILKPEVTGAELIVPSFRVVRISKVEGPLADELGRSLRGILMHALDDKKEKLVHRVNHQIAKHEDQLRFSAHDLVVKKWLGLDANSANGG